MYKEKTLHKETTCCFTGHRAVKLPWGYDEANPDCIALKEKIFDAVDAVYFSGVRHFICGMANGCDMYFGEAVVRLRIDHPEITLEAAVPYAAQADKWSADLRARYKRLLYECDYETLVAEEYTPNCMQRRNEYMVDVSSVLIAAYDGRSGGTMNTLLYAMREGIEVIQLDI